MEDLAPDIVRQRLLIEGFFTTEVDEDAVRQYFTQAPQALELQAYGTPTIFAPGGLGQEQNQGYDAFMPLIDSGISLYVWSGPRFLSVVIFACKRFNTAVAIALTRTYFGMTKVAHQQF